MWTTAAKLQTPAVVPKNAAVKILLAARKKVKTKGRAVIKNQWLVVARVLAVQHLAHPNLTLFLVKERLQKNY